MYEITNDNIQAEMENLCDKMKEMESEYFNYSGEEVFKIYAIINILYKKALQDNRKDLYEEYYRMILWYDVLSDEEEMGCVIKYYKDCYNHSKE